jgi:hypothetical protein
MEDWFVKGRVLSVLFLESYLLLLCLHCARLFHVNSFRLFRVNSFLASVPILFASI